MQNSLPKMVEEHSFGHAYTHHLDPHRYHSVYSPGGEPMYSDNIQGNGEAYAEGFPDSNFDIFGPTHKTSGSTRASSITGDPNPFHLRYF